MLEGRMKPGKRLKRLKLAGEAVWTSNEVCRFRRPAMIPEWMHAPEDGCAEIVGLWKTWPDTSGRVRVWFTTLVYFDRYYKDSMIKRYDPDDYETFVADFGRLPLIITMDLMLEHGFKID